MPGERNTSGERKQRSNGIVSRQSRRASPDDRAEPCMYNSPGKPRRVEEMMAGKDKLKESKKKSVWLRD